MKTAMAVSSDDPIFTAPIAERILDTFPSGSYALTALLRLLDIVESTSVPTAAVECLIQPRLLINPDFVAMHAQTPEKLLMLVMHELHHVLLGHTTLFPTVTMIQNFVFDTVINGVISRMFPDPDHTSFLTDYYDHNKFPECLLCPPPEWPLKKRIAGGIDALKEPLRSLASDVHAALYSATGATYQEVFDLLPKLLADDAIGEIPLLGGHTADGANSGGLETRSPILFDIVRGIVEQWPQPPDPIRGRSLASVLNSETITPRKGLTARATLRALIRKVANLGRAGRDRQRGMDSLTVPTPIPSLDRRTTVMRSLGFEPLLHTGQVPWRRKVPAGERVHVYLDVSGSMDGVKNALYGAILDCEGYVEPTVHLFSTKVADVDLAGLRAGVCKTTGGTDIACVAEHMEANRIRRTLIVTDGWVGRPRGQHHQTLSTAKLAVALLGNSTNASDLSEVANFTVPLTLGA